MNCEPASAGPDDERDVRGDARVQFDRDGVGTDGLDVPAGVDRALVQRRPAGGPDRGSDVDRRDGTEQLGAVTRSVSRDRDGQLLERLLHLVGVLGAADLARQLGALDGGNLLLGALSGDDRLALRQQEVTAVAIAYLDDVAGSAQVGHVGSENQLHELSLPYRAVEV